MNSDINDLEIKFINLKKNGISVLDEDLNIILSNEVKCVISKGAYINIRPFEIERSGCKLGKLLKKEPSKLKNTYKYHIDNMGKIRLIEIFDDNLVDKEFYFHQEDEIISYFFNSSGDIRNIKKSIINNGRFIKDFNYGKYGFSISEYIYDGDLLKFVKVFQKEHSDENVSSFNSELKYENGELKKITNVFPNGYEEQRYP